MPLPPCIHIGRRAPRTGLVLLGVLLGLAPPVLAQTGDQRGRLSANSQGFGQAVAVSGEWVAVGAPADTQLGTSAGAAWAFRRENDVWVPRKLVASDGGTQDNLGTSVDVDGLVLVAGASGDDPLAAESGSAYVFRFDGTDWVEEQKLVPSDGEADDRFGTSIAVSGDRILVGAPMDDDQGDRAGSAYVFEYDGVQWVQTQKLIATDGQERAEFGRRLALQGNRAVVGAPLDSGAGPGAGAAYVYEREGAFWRETKLTSPGPEGNGQMGTDVDIDGLRVVVGELTNEFGNDSGAGLVFVKEGSQWRFQQRFLSIEQKNLELGTSVAISGKHLALGGPNSEELGPDTGSAYLHCDDGARWIPFEKLLPRGGGGSQDAFGRVLAMDGGTLAVGAPGYQDGEVRVYAYDDLALETGERRPDPGDPLIFETRGGLAGEAVILFTIEVAGSPFFFKVAFGRFGADGDWILQGTTPPGLTDLQVVFQSIGFHQDGRLGQSTGRVVRFR